MLKERTNERVRKKNPEGLDCVDVRRERGEKKKKKYFFLDIYFFLNTLTWSRKP